MEKCWIWIFVLALAGCESRSEVENRLVGKAMGTTWNLRYVGEPRDDLAEAVSERLEELEQVFSTWREDSVVSRLNRGEKVLLPDDYRRVAALAAEVKSKSGGAFDVEIGETVKAFGFAAETAGRLDFSAIAKGFALDEVGIVVRSAGIDEFLFELGGELLGGGARDWQVGLELPDPGAVGDVRKVITLRNAAVATSGSYRLFKGDANHLIDPRTRQPVAHDCVSVSVVAKSCAEADAWATALMILGVEEGMPLAKRLGLQVYFVQRAEDGGFSELAVPELNVE